MNLRETYHNLLLQVAQQRLNLSEEMAKLGRKELEEQENWYRALALLEYSVDTLPENKDCIFDFYTRVITEGLDFKSSVYLNDEDYTFYFPNLIRVLKLMTPHFPVVYAQIAFQYREARRGYRDKVEIEKYLNLAVDLGVEVAIAVKGYFQYYGISLEKDEVAGLALLDGSDNPWSQLYRSYIALNSGQIDDLPPIFTRLQQSTIRAIKKNGYILEGHYLDAKGDKQAAKALYLDLIDKYRSDYAYFRLATLTFSEAENDADRSKAYELWQLAFELGTIDAVNHLGYHALPDNETGASFEKAIYWFNLGYIYNNPFSAFRLALLYLYTEDVKDLNKGMHFLDTAIADGSNDALIEKAELLLDGVHIEKDEAASFALFNQAAENQIPFAQNRMGYFYESGNLVDGGPDLNKAFSFYNLAAQQNFAGGINNVGRLYKNGLLGDPDMEKARDYFEKGVALKSAYSMTELALMYEDGSLHKDYQKSFELFNQAAELDYPFAVHAAASYLENGYHNQQPDAEAGFAYYQKGAELNDLNSIYDLGRCYRYGVGTSENPDKAIEYYTMAAEAGSPKAMVELGLCYEYEYGVAFDAQRAVDFMQQAADLNYYYGQYKLGYYYMHGLVVQDTEKALYWLQKAADAGYAYAMIQIGDYYLYDYDGIDQAEKAFPPYRKAQEQGVVSEGLGLCYEYGIGVETNNAEAFKYFELAANNNYVVAKYHTGRCYLDGLGVKANEEEAFRWFMDAAQQGNTAAQYNVGKLLLKGKGTAMDKSQGLEWLTKAAEENHAAAQYEMGNCYLMADGVIENEDTAMYWFDRAADNGHEKSMKLTGRKKGK